MKTYNSTNFFKYSFCEFLQISDFKFPENATYKSTSESIYFYTDKGVYRKSNHWGRVANCRWKLIADANYKNQQTVIGFAKWTDFYPIKSKEKLFFIDVNFEKKSIDIQPKKEKPTAYLFTFTDAQKRKKQLKRLFKNDKWATYFDLKIDEIRFKIITEFINSDKTLLEIKQNFISNVCR